MAVEIYHNPRCGKSRETLALLEEKGIVPKVRLYLEDPLSEKELQTVLKKLHMEAKNLLRTKEQEYKDQVERYGRPNNSQAIEWMVKFPKLMERPIVINGSKAALGRPPENVLEIL